MGRPPSPAQRAVQITFVLKGHLKNVQVAYIRVAALLAKVRDEKLYRALGHANMDDYAAARLGLQHAQLYRYLAVYDWIREFHRPWLARRPKGFIPALTDAQALMWIEHRLRDPHLSDGLRKELERLRAKALAGRLTRCRGCAWRGPTSPSMQSRARKQGTGLTEVVAFAYCSPRHEGSLGFRGRAPGHRSLRRPRARGRPRAQGGRLRPRARRLPPPPGPPGGPRPEDPRHARPRLPPPPPPPPRPGLRPPARLHPGAARALRARAADARPRGRGHGAASGHRRRLRQRRDQLVAGALPGGAGDPRECALLAARRPPSHRAGARGRGGPAGRPARRRRHHRWRGARAGA